MSALRSTLSVDHKVGTDSASFLQREFTDASTVGRVTLSGLNARPSSESQSCVANVNMYDSNSTGRDST